MALRSPSSRRYAVALLQTIEKNPAVVDATLRELKAFAEAVTQSFDLRNALLNPLITADERSKVMAVVLDKLGASQVLRRFLALLVTRDRMPELQEIADAFEELAYQYQGRVRAEVQSATQLAPETLDQLKRALERTTGKTIELDVKVDPELLGGLRARVGSIVFDGTLRAELDRMRGALMRE